MRTPFNTAAATLLVWTVATVAAAQPNVSHAPVGWDAELRLSEISDRNADPGVVELTLTAKVASVDVGGVKRVTAWTYDGGLPGPADSRARVGDRLIVHFKNELPQPTTVHWHGVRVPIEMDGVPGISQPEVRPARRSPTTSFCATRASTGITRT